MIVEVYKGMIEIEIYKGLAVLRHEFLNDYIYKNQQIITFQFHHPDSYWMVLK